MLFQRQFERLYFAVRRIAGQLECADPEQRRYLCEELAALREMGSQFFDLWVAFEDQVQELFELYGGASGAECPPPAAALAGSQPPAADPRAAARLDDALPQHDARPVLQGALRAQGPAAAGHPPAEWPAADAQPLFDAAESARLFRRGVGYFDLLMFPESHDAFRRIVDMQPDFTVARLYLALCLLARGDGEAAERQLTLVTATADEPLLAVAAREARASLYASGGRPADALRELERVIADRPEYLDAHVNAAVCAYATGQYAAAARHAGRAAELAADDASAWRLYGAALYASGRREQARRAYRQAAALRPRHPDILIEAGRIALATGRLDEAERLFRRGADAAGPDARALSGLARVALERGDAGQAVALMKKWASSRPGDTDALSQLGWMLCAGGRLDEAERLFRHLLASEEDSSAAISGLARVAALRGDADGATALLRRLLRRGGAAVRAHALTEMGRIHAECGRPHQALRYLRAALAIDGSHRDALICLGAVTRAGAMDNGQIDHRQIDNGQAGPDTGARDGPRPDAARRLAEDPR